MKIAESQQRRHRHHRGIGGVKIASEEIQRGARTMYPSMVIQPYDEGGVLKPGSNQRKIGKEVVVGDWKGMPIYTLTLEERATCPTSCHVWAVCYGNAMHMSRRFKHGPDLEAKLKKEVETLCGIHRGVVIRPHILGDFYSVEYVDLWRELLARFAGLHIFGYTARRSDDPIAAAISDVQQEFPKRFRIRRSISRKEAIGIRVGPIEPDTAITVSGPGDIPAGAFLCPAQRRDDKYCANCAACWQSDRPVAFIAHGGKRNLYDAGAPMLPVTMPEIAGKYGKIVSEAKPAAKSGPEPSPISFRVGDRVPLGRNGQKYIEIEKLEAKYVTTKRGTKIRIVIEGKEA